MSSLKTYITGGKEEIAFEEFNSEFKKSNMALIALMAPWCGHCKNLLAALKPVAEKLHGKETKVKVVVGAFHEDEFPKLHSNIDTKISGFPTIRLYKNGKLAENLGDILDRSEEGLETYIKQLMGSDSEKSSTASRKKRKYKKRKKKIVTKKPKKRKYKKKFKKLTKKAIKKLKKKKLKNKLKNKKRSRRLKALLSF